MHNGSLVASSRAPVIGNQSSSQPSDPSTLSSYDKFAQTSWLGWSRP